jgi:predicted transcriptional regulator
MTRPKNIRLGELQLRILKVLWEKRTATVGEVHEALDAGAPLAYTTVATMLRKMEERRLVKHRADGRRFLYEPIVEAEAVSRSMADDLLERVFEGSLSDMVHHLLSTREVSREELRRLEQLIAERKKRS